MTTKKNSVVLVGAGPASLYAAEVLADAGHEVIILNRDIKHGGLAEFGIYPTKYKMKSGLRKYFARVLAKENVHYFGNVRVGVEGDIHFDQLRQMGADAIVVAVGAQGTKWLGLKGEKAIGAYHAKDLVYHYNALPPYSETDYTIGKNVCVVGMGNVCLDIVHWMVCERKVETVTAIARRGPAERAFTSKELKIVSGALDIDHLQGEIAQISDNLRSIGQQPDALLNELTRYKDVDLESPSDSRFQMRFLRSPSCVEVDANNRVVGLTCEKTRLVIHDDNQRVGVERLGEYETIPCDTVIFAVGDSIEPRLGLPLDPDNSNQFATVKEPWQAYPDRPRYMVYDPHRNQPIEDCFVVGWARKASDGLVGKARADAVQGCDEVLAFLEGKLGIEPTHRSANQNVRENIIEFLDAKNMPVVTYDDIKKIETFEQAEAKRLDVAEYKLGCAADMLKLLEK